MATRKPKRILLTGASSGIGLAAASRLIGNGHQVWGTSRNPEHMPRIPGLHPVALDLASHESIEAAVATARASAGGFDVLVNNAGSGHWGPLEYLSDAEVKEQFQLLVFGPLHLIRLLLPDLCASRGKIINVSSLATQYPIPFMGPYSAAKSALSALSWVLQMELGARRVEVVDLQPGDILTRFNERLPKSEPGAYRENLERAFGVFDANHRRACGPERVGELIVRLVEANHRGPARVAVGSRFQAVIAPLLARLVPTRALRWGLMRYYRLEA